MPQLSDKNVEEYFHPKVDLMKQLVVLLFVMFVLVSCNSSDSEKVESAGSSSDSAADIAGIDVKGLLAERFYKTGVCTQQGGVYYRTYVRGHVPNSTDLYLQIEYTTYGNSTDCSNNSNGIDFYEFSYLVEKAVIAEEGKVKLELTVSAHDADPSLGNFDAYNNNLSSISVGQKDYWLMEIELAHPESDLVLPRGQDFLTPSTAGSPNAAEETFVTITQSATI